MNAARARWAFAGAVGAAMLAAGPIAWTSACAVRAGLAGLAVGLVAARPRFGGHAAWHLALATAVVAGWVTYFSWDAARPFSVSDHADAAYYHLNSRFLPELGYDALYDAMLACDDERGDPRTAEVKDVRDLASDVVGSRAEARARAPAVRARFTPDRWAAFCHDADFFLDHIPTSALRHPVFVDHGYNPPATWTLLGGAVARLVPVEHLIVATSVDDVLLAAAFLGVAWAFGPEAALWAMLFFTTTGSGRWPTLGTGLLRFDWLAALVLGVACLRKGRYGAAGALLTFAALVRVFPVVFLLAWAAEALSDLRATRSVARRHRAFLAGAGAAAFLLVGGAVLTYGPATCLASLDALALHDRSFSSQRAGLGTLLVWRGETTREALRAVGGMASREALVLALRPWLRLLAAGAALAVVAVGFRRRTKAADLAPALLLPLFLGLTPQSNYWNVRMVGVLHAPDVLARTAARVALAGWFAIEVAAQAAYAQGLDPHAVNAITSWGMLAAFLAQGAAQALTPPAPAEPPAA